MLAGDTGDTGDHITPQVGPDPLDDRGRIEIVFHPRMVMAALSILLIFTGWTSLNYNPNYLHYFKFWAGVSLVAGFFCLATVIRPTRTLVALSGAVAIVSMVSRSAAIVERVLTDSGAPEFQDASFRIAALQWSVLAYVTLVLWLRVVVPWSVMTQKRRCDGRS